MNKIKLYGFNNLTKTLSFNIYDICYAKSKEDRQSYIEYIDECYNSERLVEIMTQVVELLGATILNIAGQDYEPQGASATMLIAEEPLARIGQVAHLDKSHLTMHSYPENHPDRGVCTFRVDIDVSTCGQISPLKALPILIESFDSDIITMDYRVRGFTREKSGKKLFMDHSMTSIRDFIPAAILKHYTASDVNLFDERIFHTRMLINRIMLDNYLFNANASDLDKRTYARIKGLLQKEMQEIYEGKYIRK